MVYIRVILLVTDHLLVVRYTKQMDESGDMYKKQLYLVVSPIKKVNKMF